MERINQSFPHIFKWQLLRSIKWRININLKLITIIQHRPSNNAKRALKYKADNADNKCGTSVGWARANQLAKRENISRDTIARMASFKRHQQHKDVPYDKGCGGIMWDAWGGTSGVEWAIKKLDQIDNKKKNRMNKQFAFAINNTEDAQISRENGTMDVRIFNLSRSCFRTWFVCRSKIPRNHH